MRKALYILGSLDDTDIDWLAQNAVRMTLRPGDYLIHEGVSAEHLFIVLEGQLSVRIGEGAQHEIAMLLSGEIVGEISFVDNRKPTASVVALRESRVLALEKRALSAHLARNQGFAARFYRAIAVFLADRLFATTSRLGYGPPTQDTSAGTDVDTIDDVLMDEVSLASMRFGKLLRYLADDPNAASFAGVPS